MQFLQRRKIFIVCSENHTKHTNSPVEPSVEIMNVKPGGTYSNHWDLNRQQ